MKVTSKINTTNLKIINSFTQKAFKKSVDALKTDVQDAQIMPFGVKGISSKNPNYEPGNLQNRSMWVDDKQNKRGVIMLRVDAPYARRLYFHPEYNFQVINNPNAQAFWFEPWISGNKKKFLQIAFARFLKEEFKKHATKGN